MRRKNKKARMELQDMRQRKQEQTFWLSSINWRIYASKVANLWSFRHSSRSDMFYDWVDDKLIGLIDTYVDEMSAEHKLTVILALEYVTSPLAQRLLERIASDPQYTIQRSSNSPQTLRDVAVQILCDFGSEMAIDYLLDGLADQKSAFLERFLAKVERERVGDALQQCLGSATDGPLGRIL